MLGDEDFRLVCSHGVILSESRLKTLCITAGNKPFSSHQTSVKCRVDGKILFLEFLSNMAQTYQARIYVTLRPSVLDPAGAAVQAGIKQMGFAGISDVRIGKYVEMSVVAIDEATASTELNKICGQLLANPVIENYRIELLTAASVAAVGI
jgi:phosphoribosylformylglycinamidine synthase subunit PurS